MITVEEEKENRATTERPPATLSDKADEQMEEEMEEDEHEQDELNIDTDYGGEIEDADSNTIKLMIELEEAAQSAATEALG